MFYFISHKLGVVVGVTPKSGCTEILHMFAHAHNIPIPPKRDKMLGLHRIIWSDATQKQFSYCISKNLNDFKHWPTLIMVREPFQRLVSGIVYLVKYEDFKVENSLRPFEFFWKHRHNKHLEPQFTSNVSKSDELFTLCQLGSFKKRFEETTGIDIPDIFLEKSHYSTYDASTQRVNTVQDILSMDKLPKDYTLYFSEEEIQTLQKYFEIDIDIFSRIGS